MGFLWGGTFSMKSVPPHTPLPKVWTTGGDKIKSILFIFFCAEKAYFLAE